MTKSGKCLNCQRETENPKFCSRSCAATFNNRIHPKRQREEHNKAGICEWCSGPTSRKARRFCGNSCRAEHRKHQTVQDWLDGKTKGHNKRGIVRHSIRAWLLNRAEHKCELCHLSTWSNDTITDVKINLEIDHIDGNWKNSRPENLRALCPNCHSLTPTYKNSGHVGRGAAR